MTNLNCLDYEDIYRYVTGTDDGEMKFCPHRINDDSTDLKDDKVLYFSEGICDWIIGKIPDVDGTVNYDNHFEYLMSFSDVEKRANYIIDLIKKFENNELGLIDNIDKRSEDYNYYHNRGIWKIGMWDYPDGIEKSFGSKISIKRHPEYSNPSDTAITVYFNFED